MDSRHFSSSKLKNSKWESIIRQDSSLNKLGPSHRISREFEVFRKTFVRNFSGIWKRVFSLRAIVEWIITQKWYNNYARQIMITDDWLRITNWLRAITNGNVTFRYFTHQAMTQEIKNTHTHIKLITSLLFKIYLENEQTSAFFKYMWKESSSAVFYMIFSFRYVSLNLTGFFMTRPYCNTYELVPRTCGDVSFLSLSLW